MSSFTYTDLPIRGAKVTISDGSKTVLLVERLSFFPFYTSDSLAPQGDFKGIQGREYTLTIEVEGKTYTSITHIPKHVKTLDSLWWKPLPKITDTPLVSVMSRITDPPGFGNYVRYYVKVNRGAFLPAFISVFDDQIVDGKTYDVQVGEGEDRTQRKKGDTLRGYVYGDTVSVKFSNIDKATFDFWRTWENAYRSNGNPFSSPSKVMGNISNGALGAFCGYSVQYRTVIIPK